jgi:hypothetical protein
VKVFKHIARGFGNFLWRLEEHYVGILTTIAIHLFIISLILILKIRTNAEREYAVMIDMTVLTAEPEQLPEENRQEEDIRELVQNLNREYSIRNVPINVANERAVENIEKMVRDIKTEMNITDPKPLHDRPEEIFREEDKTPENEARIYEDKFPLNEAGERTVYRGPTTVSYDLADRRHSWMPVPAYKCRGRGKIVVDIVVNRRGYVITAGINKAGSDSEDPCLLEAAKRDAERSRFNASESAPEKQRGSITYIFIAQ